MSTRSISKIIVGNRIRKDIGDITGLIDSIQSEGLLQPIVINPDGHLIAGERRLRACNLLGWNTVPVHVVDLDEIVRGEFAENIHRKDFLPSEIDAIRRALEPLEKAAAQERMTLGKVSTGSAGKTRDKIGSFTGVSGKTVDKIRDIVEAAEADPDKYGKLVADMDRTGRVDGPHKRLKIAKQAEAIRCVSRPS